MSEFLKNTSGQKIGMQAIRDIATGAVATSGVAVSVSIDGAAEAAGGGTLTVLASGSLIYAPTQAETNGDLLVITATKASHTSSTAVIYTTTVRLVTVDTVVDAIKVKTDQMVFTTANQLDTQVISMANDSMTAAAAATDFIGAAEIAASASQEIADLIASDWIAGDSSAVAIATAVWSTGTRTITANPGLDAAGIRTAVGLASANLDTQLAADVTIDMAQATPGASTVGTQLDAAGTVAPGDFVSVSIPRAVVESALENSGTTGSFVRYRGTHWILTFDDIGDHDNDDDIYFTMKIGDLNTTLDDDAVLQAKVEVDTGTTTLLRFLGAAPDSGLLNKITMTITTYDTTYKRLTVVIMDDITVDITTVSHRYDVKVVGEESEVLDIGQINVFPEVTRAN